MTADAPTSYKSVEDCKLEHWLNFFVKKSKSTTDTAEQRASLRTEFPEENGEELIFTLSRAALTTTVQGTNCAKPSTTMLHYDAVCPSEKLLNQS